MYSKIDTQKSFLYLRNKNTTYKEMKKIFTSITLLLTAAMAQAFPIAECDTTWYTGEGTQYGGVAGSNGGNCGIYVEEDDFLHCAMNHTQYDSSYACGACVRVFGPLGELTVKVVDRCPECKHGDIDFSTEAFIRLAQLKDGRIPIKWQFVPCEEVENIKVKFEEGTSQYYFKAIFYDIKYRINQLAYQRSDGSFVPIHREMYNYYVENAGIDEDKSKIGPYTFRLISSEGDTIVTQPIEYEAGVEIDLGVQFPKHNCEDCAHVMNGEAKIDICGVCSGGTTGIEPNSTCKQDCIGYWNGKAYIDGCGFCVGGETGGTPCAGSDIEDINAQEMTGELKVDAFDMTGRHLGAFTSEKEAREKLSAEKRLLILRETDLNGSTRHLLISQ